MIYSTDEIRKQNTDLIRKYARNELVSTKNSLAKLTNLSVATCGSILNDLILTNEIIEIDLGPSSGGRPSRQFVYNYDFNFHLCMYVRTENKIQSVFYQITNLSGKVIDEQEIKFTKIAFQDVMDIINHIADKYQNINILSISVPGVIQNGSIISCDIDIFINKDLPQMIHSKYGWDVIVENDVNVLSFGSISNYQDTKIESAIYLYFPDKELPGMGIVINHKLIRGHQNFAGEIKHLPIQNHHLSGPELRENLDSYLNYITDVVQSVNAVLNPNQITISVSNLSKHLQESLSNKLLQIPFIGQIVFEEDIHETLLKGLHYLIENRGN